MSTGGQRTGVIGRVLQTVSAGSEPSGFECGFCQLTFESDRPNCPACGGPVLER